MNIICALILAAALQNGGRASDRPKALQAFVESRLSIKTASVEWSERANFNRLADERYYKRSLLANNDVAFFNRGTADGVTGFIESTGVPVSSRRNELWNASGRWFYDVGSPFGSLDVNAKNDGVDVRALGMVPSFQRTKNLAGEFWAFPTEQKGSRHYRERESDGLWEATVEFESHSSMRWWIDPSKGWNAVRSQFISETGAVLAECVVSLQKFDDETWFPEWIAYFNSQIEGPYCSVEIQSAKFNSRDLPEHLNADCIGIEPGMMVSIIGRPGTSDATWAGDRLVSSEEGTELIKKGLLKRGPTLEASIRTGNEREARKSAGLPPLPEPSPFANIALMKPDYISKSITADVLRGLWARYARDFIRQFRLDAEQSQKANLILQDCQQQAYAYLDREQNTLGKIVEEAKAEAGEKALQKLDARISGIRKPIDEIFEKQLKPRLDKLPTRAQRAAAEKSPTSAPSK